MTNGTRATLFALILAVTAVASGWRAASAQASRTDDVLPALLTEVKGLRAAMEQMASGSTQAQLGSGGWVLEVGLRKACSFSDRDPRGLANPW